MRPFEQLTCEVAGCRLCPRMDERNRVLSAANGPLHSRLMFIGEAPGRRGADATQIPFHGDKAGENFEKLIRQVGLTRYDCFITNAVLCNPRGNDGNNTTPSKIELRNCATFLRRQIELIDPSIVVTLEAQSLYSLRLIENHDIILSEGVRRAFLWYGRTLIPLYHPGQRALLHRSYLNQLADYQFVAETLRRQKGGDSKRSKKVSAKRLENVIVYCVRGIIKQAGAVGYFQLHKLFYLLECLHYRESGRRLSRAYIIRQKDNPYVTDLYLGTLKRAIEEIEVTRSGNQFVLRLRTSPDLFETSDVVRYTELDGLISRLFERYRGASNEQLKAASYMTAPMRKLLRAEKYHHKPTFNAPIEFESTVR